MRARGEALDFARRMVGHTGTQCVNWPYLLNTSGYGYFYINKKYISPHRWLCIQTHGEPAGYREAAHACGNRRCVNPAHISWKTKKGNAADRVRHGTHFRGERSPAAKITEVHARSIKSSDERPAILANRFGVTERTIYRIQSGTRWAHLHWSQEEDAA